MRYEIFCNIFVQGKTKLEKIQLFKFLKVKHRLIRDGKMNESYYSLLRHAY